jgi:CRISPR/Cas system-associated protein Csx1
LRTLVVGKPKTLSSIALIEDSVDEKNKKLSSIESIEDIIIMRLIKRLSPMEPYLYHVGLYATSKSANSSAPSPESVAC